MSLLLSHALCLLLALFGGTGNFELFGRGAVRAKSLEYPVGINPGDHVAGDAGEYWRYSSVLVKPPDDDDRLESLAMAEDVQCDACVAILQSLMRRAESHSEDHIMDQLEGVPAEMPPETDDPLVNKVNAARRGCNKIFKDDFLLRGYFIQRCGEARSSVTVLPDNASAAAGSDAVERAMKPKVWCLQTMTGTLVSPQQVNTYNPKFEGAYFSCEHTIGRYGSEIGAFSAQHLEEGVPLDSVIHRACREAAHCDVAEARRQGHPRGGGGGGGAPRKGGRRKAKKKTEDGKAESVWDMLEQDEDVSRKVRKRRRRKNKPKSGTEL